MTIQVDTRWPMVPLSRGTIEMCDGPFGSSLTSAHYTPAGPRVIRLGNIGQAAFRNADEARISDQHFATLRRHEVRAGDLLVAGLGDENNPLGRACVAPVGLGPAIVKADCFRFRLAASVFDQRFVAWALSSTAGQFAVREISRGSTRSRANLGGIASIRVPCPPIAIQRAIADFLDAETARIDDLMEARARQRGLIRERVSNVLEAAFSSAPGRRAVRLKHVLRTPPCYGVLVPRFDPDGVPFIRVGDLAGVGDPRWTLTRIDSAQSYEYSRTVVEAGDVLVSVVGSVDKCALVSPELAGANVARAVARLRPVADVPPELLQAWMSTPGYLRAASLATGSDTAQPTLNMGDLANFRLYLPESRAGIVSLATELREHRAVARAAINAIDRQTALLRERRQALITAAVTSTLEGPDWTTANAAA